MLQRCAVDSKTGVFLIFGFVSAQFRRARLFDGPFFDPAVFTHLFGLHLAKFGGEQMGAAHVTDHLFGIGAADHEQSANSMSQHPRDGFVAMRGFGGVSASRISARNVSLASSKFCR